MQIKLSKPATPDKFKKYAAVNLPLLAPHLKSCRSWDDLWQKAKSLGERLGRDWESAWPGFTGQDQALLDEANTALEYLQYLPAEELSERKQKEKTWNKTASRGHYDLIGRCYFCGRLAPAGKAVGSSSVPKCGIHRIGARRSKLAWQAANMRYMRLNELFKAKGLLMPRSRQRLNEERYLIPISGSSHKIAASWQLGRSNPGVDAVTLRRILPTDRRNELKTALRFLLRVRAMLRRSGVDPNTATVADLNKHLFSSHIANLQFKKLEALAFQAIERDPAIARGLLIWTEAWAVENRGGKRVGAGRKPRTQTAKKRK